MSEIKLKLSNYEKYNITERKGIWLIGENINISSGSGKNIFNNFLVETLGLKSGESNRKKLLAKLKEARNENSDGILRLKIKGGKCEKL